MKLSTIFFAIIAMLWIGTTQVACSGQERIPGLTPLGSPRTGSPPVALRKALAAVAVARAALAIADERPILPDTRPRNAVAPDQHSDAGDTGRKDAQGESTIPMRIEFPKTAVIQETLPAQLVVGHWASGCPAGDRQERDIRRVLTPLGWQIGNAVTDQIQFVHISQNEPCPQLTLYQNGTVLNSWEGYQPPAFLSHELRRAWDSAPTPQFNVATAGSAGAIHAHSQIHTALAWWREHLGEGTKASVDWDRTGAQMFPLLAKGDWSVLALFGKSGRIDISAVGSKSLPIPSLGFGYRVIGEDLSVDIDPVLLRGFALRLGTVKNGTDGTYQSDGTHEALISRIGPMTIWTITTIVRDVFALLNPTCDLQLGGNVSATAELSGDLLAIDFLQAPSIKLVALFTFQLSVKRVEISEESVRLVFGGSRLVKERTFQVK